ncbi:MAG TPA: HNH endonuclease [Fibrobacteria bacterium]|nr:HNH endonuclease [Fibrobacteria bacterium]
MNKWNIPIDLEKAILSRDTHCIYCGVKFDIANLKRGDKPSWEHIINNAKIITLENIALCCVSCNASKGSKPLTVWLDSNYCKRKNISHTTIATVAKNYLNSVNQVGEE